MKNLYSLDKSVALITGAASGIGENIAETFSLAGAHVIIADLNLEKAQSVASRLPNTIATQMDVSSEEDVNCSLAMIKKKYGKLDILVCNAGIQHIAPIHQMSFDNWKKVLNVHLNGAFLLTKAALNLMYERSSGTIIYIGSVHSKEASILKAPYVTAKHGIIGLSKVVAKEGAAHGVKTHVICPGFVKTPLVEKQIPEQAKALGISEEKVIKEIMLKETVDGEFTTMTDVSSLALFLASSSSKALTGQSFIVSHGWCME